MSQINESFAALFEESIAKSNMKAGEVISAEVVRIDHNFVVVNAGLKSEAFVPVEEFLNDQGELVGYREQANPLEEQSQDIEKRNGG